CKSQDTADSLVADATIPADAGAVDASMPHAQLHAERRGAVSGMLDRVFNILSLGRGA
ncbi:hypothetical protein P3T40_009230, partial [Paraburkholderia sp. EB58]